MLVEVNVKSFQFSGIGRDYSSQSQYECFPAIVAYTGSSHHIGKGAYLLVTV
jgi:hypothetical protein